jgi:hypothetical protein
MTIADFLSHISLTTLSNWGASVMLNTLYHIRRVVRRGIDFR